MHTAAELAALSAAHDAASAEDAALFDANEIGDPAHPWNTAVRKTSAAWDAYEKAAAEPHEHAFRDGACKFCGYDPELARIDPSLAPEWMRA